MFRLKVVSNPESLSACISGQMKLGLYVFPGTVTVLYSFSLIKTLICILIPLCSIYRVWWRRQGSNLRPIACKATALPTELHPQNSLNRYLYKQEHCSVLRKDRVYKEPVLLFWCEWPDSNRHTITISDFKSEASTYFATLAYTYLLVLRASAIFFLCSSDKDLPLLLEPCVLPNIL